MAGINVGGPGASGVRVGVRLFVGVRVTVGESVGRRVRVAVGVKVIVRVGVRVEIDVEVNQEVVKGQVVGVTGQTGLAGGDHLHLSVLVNGVFVNPIEWWDSHWIKDDVTRKLALLDK